MLRLFSMFGIDERLNSAAAPLPGTVGWKMGSAAIG